MVDGVTSDAVYNGEAWTTTIAAGANPRPLSITTYTEFDIEHIWPDGEVEFFYGTDIHNPAVALSLDLASDGSVAITNTEGADFKGMVSPSAKLLVATWSDPDINQLPEGESDAFLSGLDGAVSEWLVGVKRTNNPQLAGKTYRIIRQGWTADGDEFEIDSSGQSDLLVFNAGGTAVTRTTESNFNAVTFDGVLDFGLDPMTLPMSVSVDAHGKILLQGSVPGDYAVKTFGYAQEGSDLLILIDSIEWTDGGAAVGMIVAVREP